MEISRTIFNGKPEKSLQLTWIQQMASTIRHVHGQSVIIADIGTRNFLVADDLSIKLCDFTESTIMPLDVNMDEADDSGYSVQTDIGQIGAVMYEVVTGKFFDFDLFKGQDDGTLFPQVPIGRVPSQHGSSLARFNHWEMLEER